MEKGWVKLHRKITENIFLMHDNNAYLVFTKLLLMVGKEKGQWAGGRRQLGELMNMNHRTLYDVLIRLESQQLIEIESNQRYSTISICNWTKYQSQPNQEKEVVPTRAQPEPNHSPTNGQHSNKKKKEIEKKNSTNVLVDSAGAGPRTMSRKDFFYKLVDELGFSNQVMFTDGRRQKLNNRLVKFSPADLIHAARGIRNDPHLQGDNPQGKRYGTIDYLIRSDENVDKYRITDDQPMSMVGGPIDESKYV